MDDKLKDLLLEAKTLITAGKYHDADDILAPLKKEHPDSIDVARMWCALAMRTDRIPEVLIDAEKIYAQTQSDFHKAQWAHILGTASFLSLDLPTAQARFVDSISHLLTYAKSGKVPRQQEKSQLIDSHEISEDNVFASGKAEALLWKTCAELAKQNVPAFPFAGTLLGLVRNGRLLDFDKDLDIAVWMEFWHTCCSALEQAGWIKVPMRIQYANYQDYVHPELGITLDVCGLQKHQATNTITGGFSLPNHPPEYQRVSVFPPFDLIQQATDYGNAWFPQQPGKILTAFYGDWRTPNPNWDTVVSARNLQKFSLLIRCYAYHRMAQYWLTGNLAKTWCYAHQITLKDPDDVLALRTRQWMEQAMNRLNREIPIWPRNRPQKRVYTRMVADLFHSGHINFLQAARALGTHLTVCVVSDQRVLENKGKSPVMNQAERAAVVAACRHVDAVMTETPSDVSLEFMQQHGFSIYTFACATERERNDKYELCKTLPADMIRELAYTPDISTTDIIRRIVPRNETKQCP